MLKGWAILTIMFLSSCDKFAEKYRYCNRSENGIFEIDFSSRKIAWGSHGSLDQIYDLTECGKGIRSCFLGPVDFLNPYIDNSGSNINIIYLRRGVDYFYVELGHKEKYTKYKIRKGDLLPEEFIVRNKGVYEIFLRC